MSLSISNFLPSFTYRDLQVNKANDKCFWHRPFSCISASLHHQKSIFTLVKGNSFIFKSFWKAGILTTASEITIRERDEKSKKHTTYNYLILPETVTDDPGSIIPLFGLTQYRRGAVVFTLKHTFLSDGFRSLRFVVTTSVKGPRKKKVILLNMHVSVERKPAYTAQIILNLM